MCGRMCELEPRAQLWLRNKGSSFIRGVAVATGGLALKLCLHASVSLHTLVTCLFMVG